MKVSVVFYSVYGHTFEMAKAATEGILKAGATPVLRQVAETLPDAVLEKIGGVEPRKAWADVPTATIDDLVEADGILICAPTRFGSMCGQMRQFLDSTGSLFATQALAGKAGACITSTGTQHGGQEFTIISGYSFFLHQGMIVVGLPYTFAGQNDATSVNGCSPYGASTVAGGSGELRPTTIDLDGARYLGERLANIAAKLK